MIYQYVSPPNGNHAALLVALATNKASQDVDEVKELYDKHRSISFTADDYHASKAMRLIAVRCQLADFTTTVDGNDKS